MKINRPLDSMQESTRPTLITGLTLTEQGLAVTPMQLVNQVMSGSSANTSPYENGRYQEDNSFLSDEKDLATAFERTKTDKQKRSKIAKTLNENLQNNVKNADE